MIKILLTAINAKYIHANLAVYNLRAYAKEQQPHIEIAEYTINHYVEQIFSDIYERKPDVLMISCYIWNIRMVKELVLDLKKVLPNMPIWVGGPEVSYDAKQFLTEMPMIDGVMIGEGEKTFTELTQGYMENDAAGNAANTYIPTEITRGIVYRNADGTITETPFPEIIDMDTIPFCYEDLGDFENRIIYYESSRGCPYSCSYCLSSIEKKVRFRSDELVKKELQFFLDRKVPQVKFVDRTFNCNRAHTMAVWNYLVEHDNGITNFHFEVAAELLNEEELALIKTMRPGLIQLEIGVQTTNLDTIKEIHRTMDFDKLTSIVKSVQAGKNVHQHLDLIAGLPFENFTRFCQSFDDVYGLHPQQLQLGFLKVLKGSYMHDNAKKYELVYKELPVYEVLSTKWLSYEELLRIKDVEEMVEIYYNSAQFSHAIRLLEEQFSSNFTMYEELAHYYKKNHLDGRSHARIKRYEILLGFMKEVAPEHENAYKEALVYDLYLRENVKNRPSWANDLSVYKQEFIDFYKKEEKEHAYLKGYESYNHKQMSKMTHMEVFHDANTNEEYVLLFDYENREPLLHNAQVYRITKCNR